MTWAAWAVLDVYRKRIADGGEIVCFDATALMPNIDEQGN